MKVDLAVRNGWIIGHHGQSLGTVAIAGEKIVYVGPDASAPDARRVIDADERIVIPGLIDAHVHMSSEEDSSIREGLEANLPRETEGMAAGGVTTFGHFAGAPGDELVPALRETIDSLNQYSHVDSFVHAYVLASESLGYLNEVWELGIASFKHFYSAYGRRQLEDEGLGRMFHPIENDVLLRSMRWAADKGAPAVVMLHAEDGDVVSCESERVHESGRRDLGAWTEGRPEIAEVLRVRQAISLASYTDCALYIAHLTTGAACSLVADARAKGVRVTAETGPQWLTHHGGMEEEIGCWGKVNPPLRKPSDNAALWDGIRRDAVSCLGTDHGTGGRTRQMKEKGGGKHLNIWAARPGIRGGSEHLLPVMMTYGVHAGRLSLADFVRVASTNTARVFGLYPRKGVLTPGADADVVIVDPEATAHVDNDFYKSLCEVSIYEGHLLRGLAMTTIARGRVAMEDREITAQPGRGSYLPRTQP